MSEVNTRMDSSGTHRNATGAGNASAQESAVSWAAILAGAAGATALSLLLLILGTGLGLSVVSPWSMEGIGTAAFGFAAIAWLSFTQLAASGMGGYLAGRLRIKWTSTHPDEVFFRDTAHGFLAWAISSLLMVVLVTSVMGSIASSGAQAGAAVVGGAASAVGSAAETAAGSATAQASGGAGSDGAGDSIGYFVDSLFRGDRSSGSRQADGEMSDIPVGEVTRIFSQALRSGNLPEDDERYIGQLIAERTDLSRQEAQQRVSQGFQDLQTTLDDAESTAREAADDARSASAYAALWMFIALLMGAFIASLMAVFGGRQRDSSDIYS